MKIIFSSLFIFFALNGCGLNSKDNYTDTYNRHYVVVEAEITNIKKYDEFIKLEIPVLKQFDAYIAMDIRNSDQDKRFIIFSFPDKLASKKFVKSEAFQKILPMNTSSATSKIFHGTRYSH